MTHRFNFLIKLLVALTMATSSEALMGVDPRPSTTIATPRSSILNPSTLQQTQRRSTSTMLPSRSLEFQAAQLASPRDSIRDSPRASWRRRFLKISVLGLGLFLLAPPLRASASTLSAIEPVAGTVTSSSAAALAATNAAAAAAAPAITSAAGATTAPITTAPLLLAKPAISAATELRLSIRLLYAATMGALLGKERSFAKHSAGVRTMSLVAMGAASFTVCSAYGFHGLCDKYDPSRMASNVASGVGFVGAGVITTTASNKQNIVHGLTTAATIWLSAAVGVACGVGLFRIATTAALTTVTILRLGRRKSKNRSSSSTPQLGDSLSARERFASLFEIDSSTEDYVDEESTANQDDAEIHDTAVWDEHHSSVQDRPVVAKKTKSEATPAKITNTATNSKKVMVNEELDMEDVVRKAWKNATSTAVDHQAMEHLAERREQSDRMP